MQPSARSQRDRLFRRGDDQPDRAGAQGFFDGPKQIRLVAGFDEMQSLRNTMRQGTRHRPIMIMGKNDPDDRAGKPHSLKEREPRLAPSLGLMDTAVLQIKRIIITLAVPVMQDLHGCPP